jgi:hypothetical protein
MRNLTSLLKKWLSGIFEAEVPEETVQFRGAPVLNGMFGVHKAWKETGPGRWQRVFRLIINLIPTNSLQRRLPVRSSCHMAYAPLWGRMVLFEDEVALYYAEDQSYCFHVYRPGSKWRGYFVLNKFASAKFFGLQDGVKRRPRVKSAPMGWKNIVDFIQSAHEKMGTLAGVPAALRVQMGQPLPLPDLFTPRDHFSFYVDNFDHTKIVAQSDRGLYEGNPSDEQLSLRVVYEVWDVTRDVKKAAEGTLNWSSLGADQRSAEGLVGSALKFRHALLGGNLHLVLSESRPVSLGPELATTVSKNMHSVQFARPLACIFDELYRVMHVGRSVALGLDAGDELLELTASLPMHWMDLRMKFDPEVYATDASEDGAGACVSTGLTDLGLSKCHLMASSSYELDGGNADPILVVEHFGGMGGLKKSMDLLGIVPMGVIFIDNDARARKIAKFNCPFVLLHANVQEITKDEVDKWRRYFPRATKVVNAGGWPCFNHSRLNASRGGHAAESSRLLDFMLQVAEWLRAAPAATDTLPWEVVEMYENVNMDFEDYEFVNAKIGVVPFWWKGSDNLSGKEMACNRNHKRAFVF